MVIWPRYCFFVLLVWKAFIECSKNKGESQPKRKSSIGLYVESKGKHSLESLVQMGAHILNNVAKPYMRHQAKHTLSNFSKTGSKLVRKQHLEGAKKHRQGLFHHRTYLNKTLMNRNIVIRKRARDYMHRPGMRIKDTMPHNVSYSIMYGSPGNIRKETIKPKQSITKNPIKARAWNSSKLPSYMKSMYKPGYNPFNMSSKRNSSKWSPMTNFYNSDYDPYNSSSDYFKSGKSPFNKTALSEFNKKFRDYMGKKFNASMAKFKANKTKSESKGGNNDDNSSQRSVENPNVDDTKDTGDNAKDTVDDGKDKQNGTFDPFDIPSFYNSDFDPYNNSSNYPYDNKSPFNKSAFSQYRVKFQKYLKEKYNVSFPTNEEISKAKKEAQKAKLITPGDTEGPENEKEQDIDQRTLDNQEEPTDKKSDNSVSDNTDGNPSRSSFKFPSFYNNGYDPNNISSLGDYPNFNYKSPFNKTAFAEFSKDFRKYVQDKMKQYMVKYQSKNDSSAANATSNTVEKNPNPADVLYTDNEGNEITAIPVEQNKTSTPKKDTESSEQATAQAPPADQPEKPEDIQVMKDGKAEDLAGKEPFENTPEVNNDEKAKAESEKTESAETDKQTPDKEEAGAQEKIKSVDAKKENDKEKAESEPELDALPEVVDNTPVAEISQIQDGLLTNDTRFRKCLVHGKQNCTIHSDKEMVVILELEKPKDPCVRGRRRHGESGNLGEDNQDTPVVVINENPFRTFAPQTPMGTLNDLEALMSSSVSRDPSNKFTNCKATCTCNS